MTTLGAIKIEEDSRGEKIVPEAEKRRVPAAFTETPLV
jgi:hypothetical protein